MLVDELAQAFSAAEDAQALLRAVDYPRKDTPHFSTPGTFWSRVVEQACNGLLQDGALPIALAALERYPHNEGFKDYRVRALETMLVHLTSNIVGVDDLTAWLRFNLHGKELESDEDPLAHARRTIRRARDSGGLEHLLSRLTEMDPSRSKEIERARAWWHAVDPSAGAAPPGSPTEQTSERNAAGPSPASEPTHTAIVLDRTDAWRAITTLSATADGNLAFVVYGTRQQDLDLFIRRVQLYFTQREGCARPHRVLEVERDRDHSRAVTAQEWSYATVRATHARRGSLGQALAFDARTQPILIVMSARRGPFRRLSDAERVGLLEFLTTQLPAALDEVSLRNPVRVLVPLEVVDPVNPPLVRELQRAMRPQRATLALQTPMPLKIPDWPEIEDFLTRTYPELDEDALRRCEAKFEAIVRASPDGVHLEQLANPLHELVVDLIGTARTR